MKQPCPLQSSLAETLEEAEQRFDAAKVDWYLSLKDNGNIGPHAGALVAAARADTSRARKKLKAHKASHGCDPQPLRKKG
jgi:hypothetical protein